MHKIGLIFLAVVVLQVTGGAILGNNNIFSGYSEKTQRDIQAFIDNKEQIGQWIWTLNERRVAPRLEISCTLCELAIDSVLDLIHEGNSAEVIGEGLINLCITLQIVPDDICAGAVHNYVPAAVYILQAREFLTTNDLCGILIQDGGCAFTPNATLSDWTVSIDDQKPALVDQPFLPEGLPTVKVLQLTDIHLDLNYVEGSLADCGAPLCCREGTPNATQRPAGALGDYACDFPEAAMNAVFADAANRYDDDYAFVLLTGDYVHHAIWATGIEENSKHNNRVASSLDSVFQNSPIYPVLGNHEAHPCNMYPPPEVWGEPEFDLSWMFNNMADLYSKYLPAEAVESFRKAGYYTVSPSKGLRLVVLNTNFCYTLNFWLLYDTVDPSDQLQWFADTMLAAEQAGEVVLVVGHVPPGHYQCWSPWNVHFNNVINRFEGIIKAQFYGHTHEDDMKIFFDKSVDPPRPTSSLYIGASVTTYTDLNPGYKVYHFDGVEDSQRNHTWEMIDHETYIYNLTQANQEGGTPSLFKLYSAREAYGLNSLRPHDLYDFVVRMVNDDDLFQSFYRHFNKDSDSMEPCVDSECKLQRLCDVVTSDIGDMSHCERIKALLVEP